MLDHLFISLILAEEGSGSNWEYYFNYPGAEAWKFLNLFIFIGVAIYILRRPLSDAFKARRERIKQELRKAQEERDQALARLQELEGRLEGFDKEVAQIKKQAEAEAAAERERLARQTESDLAKLKELAQREIEGAAKIAKQGLREFVAQQSLQLAEETIRREIRPEDDARLIGVSVEQLGGRTN
jgi:F-type H+-transporting ATPase subunit b